MSFNEMPLDTRLQLVFNELISCHILGTDALKFGTAMNALRDVIGDIAKVKGGDK